MLQQKKKIYLFRGQLKDCANLVKHLIIYWNNDYLVFVLEFIHCVLLFMYF